ncbi:NlpC/P60 family protein [Alloiococcus sp. CFN-8]|uniref:C40 family peptidase n=1 Tax=Alloiococcus sp. CFN-8 TaxID=3416081 RepID=UPI003CF68D5A
MNKKLVALVLTVAIASGQAVSVLADPVTEAQVQESRNQLQSIERTIGELEDKIGAIDGEVASMEKTIEDNNKQIEAIKAEIQAAEAEVLKLQKEVEIKEELLAGRIRGMYKSGGNSDYLTAILNSESFSDFIARVQAISKIIGTDNKLIDELNASREAMDNIKKELVVKNEAQEKLKKENEEKLALLEEKRAEQNALVEQARAERALVQVDLEREEAALVDFPISVIDAGGSTDDEIQNSINTLVNIRSSIVTASVDGRVQAAINKGNQVLGNRAAEREAQIRAEQARAEQAERARREAEEASRNSQGNNSEVSKPADPKPATPKPATPKPNNPAPPSRGDSGSNVSGNNIVNYAYSFLGVKYVYGGTTPSGFDCSGFTQYVYNHFGINITRTTFTQVNVGRAVSRAELQPGDLVFTSAGHVGIYVGNGRMIHAPQTGDNVKVSNIWSFYAARRIVN